MVAEKHSGRRDVPSGRGRPGVICIDVTALFALARATGIQRVVRTILADASEFRLVAFDSALGSYRELHRLPEARKRADSQRLRRFRNLLRLIAYFLWLVLGRLMAPFANTRLFQQMKRLAGGLYSRYLGEVTLPDEAAGLPLSVEDVDSVWLLDIPKTDAHLRFLFDNVVSSEVTFGVYVYDLIPVDSPELIDAPDRRTLVKEYEHYLELVAKADRVFCLSAHTLERLTEYWRSRGNALNAIPRVVYPPMVQSMESARKAKRDGSDAKSRLRIFGLAPLNRRKNLQVVLRAVRGAIRSGVKADLTLVVPIMSAVHFPTALLALWMAVRYPKQVRLFGPVDYRTLVGLYQWCDVVVVPSRSEGFGLPIIEALSAGKPVVASACTSFLELAQSLPIRLADPDDSQQWHEALFHSTLPDVGEVDLGPVLTSPEQFRELIIQESS